MEVGKENSNVIIIKEGEGRVPAHQLRPPQCLSAPTALLSATRLKGGWGPGGTA